MVFKKKEVIVEPIMETEVIISAEPLVTGEYFRLVRTDRNLYQVENVSVVDSEIVKVEADDPSFLPIAFDKLRRKTAQAYFEAVKLESKGGKI